MGGAMQSLLGSIGVHKEVIEAFRKGGGVPQSAYSAHMWEGLERFTGSWFENQLFPVWLPLMPDVKSKLEQGATLADVGCGRGRALIKLAKAFPKSRFIGFDIFEPTVGWALRNAAQEGVGDRISVHHLDVVEGLPEQYDIITTFDVVHDAANPQGLLDAIRRGLKPGGIYVCLDINCSDKLEENIGPLGSLFHGFSVLYCMTTSLAQGGVGLGTLGFHEPKVNEMCAQAGFSSVRRVPIDNPFNNLYEIRT
jgi:cyclopropane fatty-acyl-phospholipid synthase-like methyltransferase